MGSIERESGRPEPRSAVFVPGLRLPGTKGADVRVFRPLVRALGPESWVPFLYSYGRKRRSGQVLAWDDACAGSEGARYGFLDTVGPVNRLAAGFSDGLGEFLRARPGSGEEASVDVVAYSVGGVIALNAVALLGPDQKHKIGRLVLLAAPIRGFDRMALKEVFGPPFLSRGVDVLERVTHRLYPGFGLLDFDSDEVDLPPTLCVAVEGDAVAPPQTALLGWPDKPPIGVDWFRIQPKSPAPKRFSDLRSLKDAMDAVSQRHGEVILRRDAIRTIAKFLQGGRS